jgi:hypothetical protein
VVAVVEENRHAEEWHKEESSPGWSGQLGPKSRP